MAASIDLPPSAALDRQAGGGGGAPAEVPANRTYQPSVVLVDNAAGSSSSRSGSPFAVAAEGAAETLRAGESSGDGSGGDGSGGDGGGRDRQRKRSRRDSGKDKGRRKAKRAREEGHKAKHKHSSDRPRKPGREEADAPASVRSWEL